MPSELLHFPPLYTLVGLYRLLSDPSIRTPVFDKVKHATARGLIVAAVYAVFSWSFLDWVIRRFLIGGSWWKKGEEVMKESVDGTVRVGFGRWGVTLDVVLYTHLLMLLPQLSSILRFFIYKNLKLARSRAYALTVSSRGKPREFWSQGYIEEWAQPPVMTGTIDKNGKRMRQSSVWLSWILWWPTQLVMRKYLLLPLSPTLPLLSPLLTALLKSLHTASYLHQPYFLSKNMSDEQVWRWVEERRWAYRMFGFGAAWVESVPVLGLGLSIGNRVGAAMWAFDMEKRQHLFAHNIIQPLLPSQVGFYGMGRVDDLGVDIQRAEDELEVQWSRKKGEEDAADADAGAGAGERVGGGVGLEEEVGEKSIFGLRGEGLGAGGGGTDKGL
ncbi:hypothetical protein B9479_006669 [Cryptococcus floricola]|uniref:Uncharacterized protein n=1 Tax=Cryptococcus floricola TaxID=2591691 RepID=A0A5D3AML5_9TREE|nr:hypothetical protein B9479_006669 [Cryptococcus floricola]